MDNEHPEPFTPAPGAGSAMIDAMNKALGKTPVTTEEPKKEEAKPKVEAAAKVEKPTEVKPVKKASLDFPEKPAAAATTKPDANTTDPEPGSKEYNYKQLESKASAASKEAAELRRQLAELKVQSETNEWKTKFESTAKEKEDLSNRLMQASLERHPKFQAHYNGQFDSIAEQIKAIAPGALGEKLAKASKNGTVLDISSDPDVENAIDELPSSKKMLIGPLLTRAAELHSERARALETPAVHLEDASKADNAKREEWFSKANSTFETEQSKAMGVLPVFQHRDGDAEWNAEVDNSISLAKDTFESVAKSDISVSELSKLCLWATAGPKFYNQVEAMTGVIAGLNAKIAAMESAQPGLKGASANGGSRVQTPTSFQDRVAAALGR